MMRMPARVVSAIALVTSLAAGSASAHDLDHTITMDEATTITLFYPDGAPFSFETYEVIRPGEDSPFQVGRTDRLGRIIFVPDTTATWRVRAFSEDGHGVDLRVDPLLPDSIEGSESASSSRSTRFVLGLGIILGVFGIIALFRARSKS